MSFAQNYVRLEIQDGPCGVLSASTMKCLAELHSRGTQTSAISNPRINITGKLNFKFWFEFGPCKHNTWLAGRQQILKNQIQWPPPHSFQWNSEISAISNSQSEKYFVVSRVVRVIPLTQVAQIDARLCDCILDSFKNHQTNIQA